MPFDETDDQHEETVENFSMDEEEETEDEEDPEKHGFHIEGDDLGSPLDEL